MVIKNNKQNQLLNILFYMSIILVAISCGQIVSMIIQKRVFDAFFIISIILIICLLIYIALYYLGKFIPKKTLTSVKKIKNKKLKVEKEKVKSRKITDEMFLIWCKQNENKVFSVFYKINILRKIFLSTLVVIFEVIVCSLLYQWHKTFDYLDSNGAIPIIFMSISVFVMIGVISTIIKDDNGWLNSRYSSFMKNVKDTEGKIISNDTTLEINSMVILFKMIKVMNNIEKDSYQSKQQWFDVKEIEYVQEDADEQSDEANISESNSKNERHTSSNVKKNNENNVEFKTEIPLSSKRLETQEKEICVANNKNVSNRSCGYAYIDELKAGLENVFNKLSGDFSGAKSAILKEVENGDANAMLNLGNIYLNGSGVELDKKKAYYYYRIAAYMGFASAIGYVGNYYLDEEEDLYKSLVWHSIAAKKKNAYAAVRAWQTLCNLSLTENNMYYSHLSDFLASKAMEFGYPLKQRVPTYQPMNFPYTKEEKEVFIKKFNDVLEVVKQESNKEKEQIFNDSEIPEIVKKKIKSIDIFEQNSGKVITVEEPILGTSLKHSVKYLCEDSEVCVGDLMYFHYLDYVPEPVKIISVLDTKLSKTEREKLYSANYITWLSSNDNSLIKVEIDDYNKLGCLINYYKNEFNEKIYKEFDEKLQNIKLSPINFEKLKKDSNDIYRVTDQQDREQNIIIQEVCVPLKRAGYFDSANKVYKYIYKTYGFSQTLINSWAKIFVCNKQFDIAYKLFELGDNQYKYRIKIGDLKPDPITTMLFGGVMTSQCYENMKRVERAMNDYQYALQLVRDMGGNPDMNTTSKLE